MIAKKEPIEYSVANWALAFDAVLQIFMNNRYRET